MIVVASSTKMLFVMIDVDKGTAVQNFYVFRTKTKYISGPDVIKDVCVGVFYSALIPTPLLSFFAV